MPLVPEGEIRKWPTQKGAEYQTASGGGFPWYAGKADPPREPRQISQAITLIQGIQAEHLLADKGYDSNEIVTAALARGINPVIPPKSNRKDPRYYDQDLYKLRDLVENAFLQAGSGNPLRQKVCFFPRHLPDQGAGTLD